MTNHTAYPVQDGTVVGAQNSRDIARKAARIALVIVVGAALAAAWLAFFMLLPLDFSALTHH